MDSIFCCIALFLPFPTDWLLDFGSQDCHVWESIATVATVRGHIEYNRGRYYCSDHYSDRYESATVFKYRLPDSGQPCPSLFIPSPTDWLLDFGS